MYLSGEENGSSLFPDAKLLYYLFGSNDILYTNTAISKKMIIFVSETVWSCPAFFRLIQRAHNRP